MEENGMLLAPGHEHFLSLSSNVYEADGIEELSPENRDCFFPEEGPLDFYKKYTFQSCKFECGIKLAESRLGCIPWYLPQGDNSTACDPWTARNFTKMLGEVHSGRNNCKQCLPDCRMTETTVLSSAAKFR